MFISSFLITFYLLIMSHEEDQAVSHHLVWSDLTKEEQIIAAKEFANDVKIACEELISKLESNDDIEEVGEPDCMIHRSYSTTTGKKTKFSFTINFSLKGLAKSKKIFWPMPTKS